MASAYLLHVAVLLFPCVPSSFPSPLFLLDSPVCVFETDHSDITQDTVSISFFLCDISALFVLISVFFFLQCRWNPKASARKLSPNWEAGQRLAFGVRTKRSVIRFTARKSDCWSRQRGNTEWKVGNNSEFRLTGDHTHSAISQHPK